MATYANVKSKGEKKTLEEIEEWDRDSSALESSELHSTAPEKSTQGTWKNKIKIDRKYTQGTWNKLMYK